MLSRSLYSKLIKALIKISLKKTILIKKIVAFKLIDGNFRQNKYNFFHGDLNLINNYNKIAILILNSETYYFLIYSIPSGKIQFISLQKTIQTNFQQNHNFTNF